MQPKATPWGLGVNTTMTIGFPLPHEITRTTIKINKHMFSEARHCTEVGTSQFVSATNYMQLWDVCLMLQRLAGIH